LRVRLDSPTGVDYSSLLHLNFSPYQHIFNGIGKAFPNIFELTIQDQNIRFVDRENFKFMDKLLKLFLFGNKIEYLAEDTFRDLILLNRLDLSHNRIKQLPQTIFHHFTTFNFLNLGYNQIAKYPRKLLDGKFNPSRIECVVNPGNFNADVDLTLAPSHLKLNC
jgi:Leucine-rich repeat (LRR) protein